MVDDGDSPGAGRREAEDAAEPPVDELETLGHHVARGGQEQEDQGHPDQHVDYGGKLS